MPTKRKEQAIALLALRPKGKRKKGGGEIDFA